MKGTYKDMMGFAGRLRKKHGLTIEESLWCALWLAGEKESRIPALAEKMAKRKYAENKEGRI